MCEVSLLLQDPIFSGPKDLGPGTQDPRPMDPNRHTLYVYIHGIFVSTHLTGMHYGMDCEILCAVDGTFVLVAFVPFHSVRHQKRPLLLQVRCTKQRPLNLLNMHVTFDPQYFEEDE